MKVISLSLFSDFLVISINEICSIDGNNQKVYHCLREQPIGWYFVKLFITAVSDNEWKCLSNNMYIIDWHSEKKNMKKLWLKIVKCARYHLYMFVSAVIIPKSSNYKPVDFIRSLCIFIYYPVKRAKSGERNNITIRNLL